MEKTYSECSDDIKVLLQAAKNVSANAFNKYSGYQIGAAVRVVSGELFAGTFFETASGPEGVCAERVAIGMAVSSGNTAIAELAVVGGHPQNNGAGMITPCGGCRQAIYEMANENQNDITIYCSDLRLRTVLVTSAYELLPKPFNQNV